ncbi:MAG: hypothetical protein ABMA14_06755 [Hyphomonadaceae bacterium]
MADGLLILHFVGLMLAASGVVGALASLASARPAARGKAAGKRSPGRIYARLASFGAVLMVPSGIGLLVVKPWLFYPGAMFWMKLAFTAAFTLAIFGIEMVYAGRTRQGGNLLASLSPLAGLSLLATVIFSVLAFH